MRMMAAVALGIAFAGCATAEKPSTVPGPPSADRDAAQSGEVSDGSAARALFGEIPIRGRLPVTIPGVADRGDGITP